MPATPALPAELTIYTAVETRAALLALLAAEPAGTGEPFVLDAAAVAEVDAAGAQLLVALRHSLADHGRALVLASPAPALRLACAALGLDELMPQSALEATP